MLHGVSDARTLEALSTILGEYDRCLVSVTDSVASTPGLLGERESSYSDGVTYTTTRQRTLSPGEIAALPAGHGLLVRGADWGLIEMAPWYRTPAFRRAAQAPPTDRIASDLVPPDGDGVAAALHESTERHIATSVPVRAAAPAVRAARGTGWLDASWWLLYALTMAAQLISVIARAVLFTIVA